MDTRLYTVASILDAILHCNVESFVHLEVVVEGLKDPTIYNNHL